MSAAPAIIVALDASAPCLRLAGEGCAPEPGARRSLLQTEDDRSGLRGVLTSVALIGHQPGGADGEQQQEGAAAAPAAGVPAVSGMLADLRTRDLALALAGAMSGKPPGLGGQRRDIP